MVKNVYGIKDTCLNEFINQFLMENDAVATRAFKQDINNAPERVPVADLVLCRLGSFDTVKGEYSNDYKFIASAIEFLGGESCQDTTPMETDQQ